MRHHDPPSVRPDRKQPKAQQQLAAHVGTGRTEEAGPTRPRLSPPSSSPPRGGRLRRTGRRRPGGYEAPCFCSCAGALTRRPGTCLRWGVQAPGGFVDGAIVGRWRDNGWSMPAVREVLSGRYELLEVLGRGGMGVVFRARDRVLGRVVAVKVLPAERAEDETFVARFVREARAAAALNHPNIAAVFDTGRDEDTRFIVMEFVSGSSLAAVLRRRGSLPATEATAIAAGIAGALDAAHGAGIIHRDVKPANVMVDDRGAVKVLDFGIARVASDTSLTQTATVLGSAPYLAPEVARGERADERSDIYSLGCVLYELLTERPPFTGELPAAVLHQHATAPPRPPRELNPRIPDALDALVVQMLAKAPSARPQHVRDVARALLNPGERPPAQSSAGAASRDPSAAPRYVRARSRPLKLGPRAALAIVIGLACLGLVLLLLGSSSPKHRAGNTSAARTSPVHTGTARASSPSTTESTNSPPPASAPPTVPAAAAQLTRLAAQDQAAGTIDQPASQQILARLQDILNTYGKGNSNDTTHKLDDFSQQVAQLSQHGDIQPAALPAISRAIDALRAALARAAPADTNPPPAPVPTPPKHPKPAKPPHH